jgi:hypothetical protein
MVRAAKEQCLDILLLSQSIDPFNDCCWGKEGTIAHIMLFINAQTNVRLHLLHSRFGDQSLAIQERGKNSEPLFVIHGCDIPRKMESRHFDLPSFDEGKHELELVAKTSGEYHLEDILVEFFDDDVKSIRRLQGR